MSRLAGSIAAVTGGGGPMGFAVAGRLLQDGAAALALTDISQTRLDEAVRELNAAFPAARILARRADVTKGEEAAAFAEAAATELGPVELLVNLVGGLRSRQLYTPFLQIGEEQWRQTFELNLMGGFHLMQRLVPGMLEQGGGRVVNVASIVFGGEVGQADYAAAKAAVASLTRSLAAEFAPDVTVNCVAPGLTRTSVTERMPAEEQARLTALAFHRRMAEPEEIASAVAYFLSEEARFVTGEILAVSGGIHPHL
ncbi:SDR family NAD(P)-dependent oxidoreductase [Afifella pfennigii]|uniref:SDR family NAD(P)-dependent oxidoreductase n=1 Tax=Afifella pfennigii TaxID=209897 RepID=UPI00047E6528|nr:SDR family oxidoreductase [Afifella pfennigii]